MKWWHGSWDVKQEAKKFIGFDKKEDVFLWFYYGEFEQRAKKNNWKGTKCGTKDQRFGMIYVTAVHNTYN